MRKYDETFPYKTTKQLHLKKNLFISKLYQKYVTEIYTHFVGRVVELYFSVFTPFFNYCICPDCSR